MNDRIILAAVVALGVVGSLCVGGAVVLAAMGRDVPAGVAFGIMATVGGLLGFLPGRQPQPPAQPPGK